MRPAAVPLAPREAAMTKPLLRRKVASLIRAVSLVHSEAWQWKDT